MNRFSVPGWLVTLALMTAAGVAQSSPAPDSPLYLDPAQPVEVRVNDLVSRMTLEEKISQLVNQSREIPRLQVPTYDWWSEALHGVAGPGIATVFPEPIGLAATFDAPLIHQMGAAIGTEGRAKHNIAVRAGRRDLLEGLDFWSPNINIARDPRWGRNQETYGEDPFLTGRMGVAFVTGMQGDDPKYLRVIATPKHFAVHSGPEPVRHTINVVVSKHDMEDTYLPAFRAAVVEGHAGSVMCSYNSVNGEPACANTFLLQNQLRGAWKFDGYVVTDCDAVDEILSTHHFTRTIAEAAAISMKAGVDNECVDSYAKATDNSDYVKYLDAVKLGLVTEKDVDTSVERLLAARFRLGLFDPPELVKYAQTPDSEVDSAAHRLLALTLARESMVLLKNDGLLPLGPNVKRIAVVGSLADSVRVLNGNYNGQTSRAASALQGIQSAFATAKVTFAPGVNFMQQESLVPAAVFSTTEGKPGLNGEYFANEEFQGQPVLVRVDNRANLEALPPDKDSLIQPPGLKEFSVRWTGFLTPDESADYQIEATGFTNKLWLDDKVVLDNSKSNLDGPRITTISLKKGRRYAIKLECAVQDDLGATLLWARLLDHPLKEAIEAAQNADVAVAVVGITSQLEGEELRVNQPGFKGGDRTSLDLPQEEEDLVEAMSKTGKPLVVVLMNGSALAVNWAAAHANAILEAWYGGEEGGTAIAETLSGQNNPAGRLPVTFYKGTEQLPAFEDYSMKNRTYRYFAGEPLYPFGFGLSYSQYAYDNLKLSQTSLHAGDSLGVDVDVSNRSKRDGDEVVELYLSFPKVAGAPLRALRGFVRIHLATGAQQHVHLDLSSRDLSMVNESGDRVVAAGDYAISIGGGQPATGASGVQATFAIRGEQRLPE
jgi:beta-glucosidase